MNINKHDAFILTLFAFLVIVSGSILFVDNFHHAYRTITVLSTIVYLYLFIGIPIGMSIRFFYRLIAKLFKPSPTINTWLQVFLMLLFIVIMVGGPIWYFFMVPWIWW